MDQKLKVWEVLNQFREWCQEMPWEASKDGSWFKIGKTYHAFIWCSRINPATFKSLVDSRRLSLSDGQFWKIQKVSHIAFICTSGLTRELLDAVESKSQTLNRVALFDLDNARKIGGAVSPVFLEFERFMRSKFGFEFRVMKGRDRHRSIEANLAIA